jgi:putative Ca2+/H+ antiporter (TMEM165/GDT1 family)
MDALMTAIVAAALAQVGDRPAWLAAILADRYRSPLVIIAVATLALFAAGALAATAGALLAPKLTPNAKLLMLSLALLFQGAGGFTRVKMPDRLEGWRLGAWATAGLGLFILAFGDGVQFIVATLAARSPLPWLAAAGATLGSMAVIAPAALMGERSWTALPLRPARMAASAVLLVAGAVLALTALQLV